MLEGARGVILSSDAICAFRDPGAPPREALLVSLHQPDPVVDARTFSIWEMADQPFFSTNPSPPIFGACLLSVLFSVAGLAP